MAKKPKKDPIKQEKEYIAFLEKRLASKNYQARATPEEIEKDKEKLKKARLKLRLLEPAKPKKK